MWQMLETPVYAEMACYHFITIYILAGDILFTTSRVSIATVCDLQTVASDLYNCTDCGKEEQKYGTFGSGDDWYANSIYHTHMNAQACSRHATSFTESTAAECALSPGNKYDLTNRLAGGCSWNIMATSTATSTITASLVHIAFDTLNRILHGTIPSTYTIWMIANELGNTSAFRMTGERIQGLSVPLSR